MLNIKELLKDTKAFWGHGTMEDKPNWNERKKLRENKKHKPQKRAHD